MQGESEGTNRASYSAWLRLAKPIPATYGDQRVLVLDLGPWGALLSGQCDYLQGAEHDLVFLDRRGDVSVRGTVTGVADHDLSGHRDLLIRFTEPGVGLSDYIERYREQIRRAELANAEGDMERNVIDGDRMLSDLGSAARSNEPFVRCRLNGGVWTREITADREQPPDGFTISAAEPEDQIALLQVAYEEADDADRNAIREFAAVTLPPAR